MCPSLFYLRQFAKNLEEVQSENLLKDAVKKPFHYDVLISSVVEDCLPVLIGIIKSISLKIPFGNRKYLGA
jgi:hypothetical protein